VATTDSAHGLKVYPNRAAFVGLMAIPNHPTGPILALLAWVRHLLRRQLQHGLDRGTSGYINQIIAGASAVLD
jgi:hypothetical protein